jgi:putative ABC transport system substrate-binding protein
VLIDAMQAAAARVQVEVKFYHASTVVEIDAAFARLVQNKTEALVGGNGPPFNDRVVQVVSLATRHALPAIFGSRDYTGAGGLMSYAASPDRFRQVGIYVGRIIKGERPADLPVMLPTKFELVINLKTARALGLEIPPQLLALADEVIE